MARSVPTSTPTWIDSSPGGIGARAGDRGMKRDAPATHRNREPILEVLARWLDEPARVLEIASGTGQHAVHFARNLPLVDWQPTEYDEAGRASIAAWRSEAGLPNLLPPLALDAADLDWSFEDSDAKPPFDAVFNSNLIHIAPWPVALGLFAGVGRVLRRGGCLFLYGPFRIGGVHTAPSNAEFDRGLRERDPRWGVRELERVVESAEAQGLAWAETNDLPANNKLVVFRREG